MSPVIHRAHNLERSNAHAVTNGTPNIVQNIFVNSPNTNIPNPTTKQTPQSK